jgi:hypothetical protein
VQPPLPLRLLWLLLQVRQLCSLRLPLRLLGLLLVQPPAAAAAAVAALLVRLPPCSLRLPLRLLGLCCGCSLRLPLQLLWLLLLVLRLCSLLQR